MFQKTRLAIWELRTDLERQINRVRDDARQAFCALKSHRRQIVEQERLLADRRDEIERLRAEQEVMRGRLQKLEDLVRSQMGVPLGAKLPGLKLVAIPEDMHISTMGDHVDGGS